MLLLAASIRIASSCRFKLQITDTVFLIQRAEQVFSNRYILMPIYILRVCISSAIAYNTEQRLFSFSTSSEISLVGVMGYYANLNPRLITPHALEHIINYVLLRVSYTAKNESLTQNNILEFKIFILKLRKFILSRKIDRKNFLF